MVIVLLDGNSCVECRRATLRERIASRIRASSLDRELAQGSSPEGSALLAIRAHALVQPRARQEATAAYTELAWGPAGGTWYGSRLIDWAAVLDAQAEFGRVVDLLRAPRPLSAAGMAQLHLILTDGAGPLYRPGEQHALRCALRNAIVELDCT